MTHTTQRPTVGRERAEALPELELIKIFGFVMVIACHFWVQHVLPTLFGMTSRVAGMGIDASTPSRIDLNAWFPTFSEHSIFYSAFNLFFGFGYQGVGVFFILTGFGLTLSALNKPRFNPWAYLVGRFERVYLPYLFLLAAYTVFNWWMGGRSLLDLRAFVLMDTGIPYAWFLFPLLQFYIVFPFLFLVVRAKKISPHTLLGGAIAINFAWAFGVMFVAYNFMPSLAVPGACAPKGLLPFRIAEPVFGMWLAYFYHRNRAGFENLFKLRRWPLFAAIYAGGCVLSLAEMNLDAGKWIIPLGQSVTNLLVAVGLFGLMLQFSRAVQTSLQKLQPLSRYGFEFYLVQAIPLAGAAWLLPQLTLTPFDVVMLLVALLIVNFFLAAGIHHFSKWALQHTYYRLKSWSQRANAPEALPETPSQTIAPVAPAIAAVATALASTTSKAPFVSGT